MVSSNLVRWGALGALVAGVAWLASFVVGLASEGQGSGTLGRPAPFLVGAGGVGGFGRVGCGRCVARVVRRRSGERRSGLRNLRPTVLLPDRGANRARPGGHAGGFAGAPRPARCELRSTRN